MTWVKSTEIYTRSEDSYKPLALFGNSYSGEYRGPSGVQSFSFGTWQTYDLKPLGVASDANFAAVGGILIITGAAEIDIAFRAPGSNVVPDWTYYQEQLLSASPSSGERSVTFDLIPLVNGCFECAIMAKKYPADGSLPAPGSIPAVGWNLKLKGWGR